MYSFFTLMWIIIISLGKCILLLCLRADSLQHHVYLHYIVFIVVNHLYLHFNCCDAADWKHDCLIQQTLHNMDFTALIVFLYSPFLLGIISEIKISKQQAECCELRLCCIMLQRARRAMFDFMVSQHQGTEVHTGAFQQFIFHSHVPNWETWLGEIATWRP